MAKGISGGIYRPLTDDQVERIHAASLKILAEIGLAFESDLTSLLETVQKPGVVIDSTGRRVFFETKLVEELIANTPRQVVLCSRNGERDVKLGDDRVYFATGGTSVNTLDLDTGQCRPSCLVDIYQIARLVDRMENIDLFLRPTTPNDLPLKITDVNIAYAAFKGTAKHVNMGVFVEAHLPQIIDMAAMVAGGSAQLETRPCLSIHATCAISPLKLDTTPLRTIEKALNYGIPVSLGTAPMAGSTGPVTLAGTLALLHAELMAAVAIAQLIKPGAAVIVSPVPVTADMATMNFLSGTVESAMMMAAAHQLARHIGVPNFISAGWVDSKLPDAQAGWEAAITLVLAAMGGGNCIRHAAGLLDSAMTVAFEQYVIGNEIIGIARRLLEGIDTSAEHIAYDVIRSVGPGGEFITSDHTLRHMRKEHFSGCGATDRRSREQWARDGAPDTRATARRIVRQILSAPEKYYIAPATDRQIRARYDIRLNR